MTGAELEELATETAQLAGGPQPCERSPVAVTVGVGEPPFETQDIPTAGQRGNV